MEDKEIQKQIEVINNDLITLDKRVKDFSIVDEKTMGESVSLLSLIKTMQKKVEEKRKELTQPLNEVIKKINAEFKKLSIPLETYERTIKNEQLKYYKEQEEIRKKAEEERKRIEEQERKKIEEEKRKYEDDLIKNIIEKSGEIEMKDKLATIEIPKVEKKIEVGNSSIQVRTIKKWRLVDIKQVPIEYIKIDEVKVNKAMRENIEIPGIEYYEEKIISAK